MNKKATLLITACVPALCGPGYHLLLWHIQKHPPQDQWYRGNHFGPWHEELLGWVAVNLITMVLSIGGAILVSVRMDRRRTKFLALLPPAIWGILFFVGFARYGWALD